MNNLNKLLFIFSLSTCFSNFLFSQTTGSFNKEIDVDGNSRYVEYAVPLNYNANEKHGLLVALSGCGNTSSSSNFRNQLEFMNNDFKTIVVSPIGLGSLYHKLDDADSTIISKSIQDAISTYNIDEGHVFLTGFSCNGYVTAKYGTYSTIFPFAGIIPYNAGINSTEIEAGDFNLDTAIPTCVCIGDQDPNLEANKALADSIVSRGGDVLLREMIGVGHTTGNASFKNEISACMTWFNNQIPALSTEEIHNENNMVEWYNSKGRSLSFEFKKTISSSHIYIFNTLGECLRSQKLSDQHNILNFDDLNPGPLFISLKIANYSNPITHLFMVE